MGKPLNRAEFVHGIMAVVATGVGLRLGLDRLDESLDLDERKTTFRELYENSHTEEGKRLLVGWLKLNVVEAYARTKGWELTAEANRRFLVGDGSAWNITEVFENHLLSEKGPFEGKIIDPRVAWGKYFGLASTVAFYNAYVFDAPYEIDPIVPVFKRKLIRHKPMDFEFKGTTSRLTEDMAHALGRFALHSTGRLEVVEELPDMWNVVLRNGVFALSDRHDWNPDDPNAIGGGISLLSVTEKVLGGFGIQDSMELLHDLFDSEALEKMNQYGISLHASEILPLQEKGILHPFDVYTDPISVNTDVYFDIQKSFFDRLYSVPEEGY